MRIISGRYKGRLLQMPKGIRPTQQRVRKAIFDILGDLEGVSFLELFAGSAAVGFEALSYGAREVVLAENNSDCLAAIRQNIEKAGLSGCRVIGKDAEAAVRDLSRQGERFDVVFLDPPYHKDLAKNMLQTISGCDILAPTGLVVVQHFKKDILPEALGVLHLFRQSFYGDTLLSFFRKAITK